MKDKKMVHFDWNGTLIDDTPIWHQCMDKPFELCGVKPPTVGDYFKKWEELGGHLAVYHFFGANLTKEKLDMIYFEEYRKRFDEIKLSPYARWTIASLRRQRVALGIITAQPKSLFEPIFLRLRIKDYFDEVVTDAQKKKPCILRLCQLKNVNPENCYYVGDSPSDITQAKQAGVKAITYLTPYVPRELLLSMKPDFAISDLREILRIIKTDRKKEPNG